MASQSAPGPWSSAGVATSAATSPAPEQRLLNPAPSLPAVPRQRLLDDREGKLRRLDLVPLDELALELRVVLEEPPQHVQAVAGHLGGPAVAGELPGLRRDRDDLVVLLPPVGHPDDADGARVD